MPRYPEKYDNFGMSTFKRCAREGHYRIDRDLVPSGKGSSALLFGSMMHKALDKMYEEKDMEKGVEAMLAAYHEDPFEDQKRSPMRGAEMLAAYWDYWQDRMEEFETVGIEVYFEFPLWGVDDLVCDTCHKAFAADFLKGDSCGFETCKGTLVYRVVYCGLIDKIERNKKTGEVIGKDHKTTSYLDGSYLESMKLSSQFMGYYFWLANHSPWKDDVGNTFLADFLLTAQSSKYAEQPGLPLRRENIHATPEILTEWQVDTQQWVETIQEWRTKSGYAYGHEFNADPNSLPVLPPKNPDNCSRYRSLCPFYGLCSHPPIMRDTHINMLYEESEWDPQNR
jgi:hypothetical protein|tara:strand:+ start:953 stop:1966 length:1014 start_codon:yes stop_codon:yes gene_type:complete